MSADGKRITSGLLVPGVRRGLVTREGRGDVREVVERHDVIGMNRPLYRSILDERDQVWATTTDCASPLAVLDYGASRVEVIDPGIDTRGSRREASNDEWFLAHPEWARAVGRQIRRQAVEIFDDQIALGQHLAGAATGAQG